MNLRYLKTMIILLVLAITACQAKAPATDEVCPIDETTGEIDPDCAPINAENETGAEGYPVEEAAYPSAEFYNPVPEDAYPITEADLTQLLKIWRLTSYAENGIESGSPLKVLTFTADSSYSIATETELETGTWTTILLAVDSTLILTPESGEMRYYQIIELGEDVLNLRSQRGVDQIDEGYLPDDSSCGCN